MGNGFPKQSDQPHQEYEDQCDGDGQGRPAGISFDLIGDGPDDYVDFEKTGQTSTGADQPITVTADANLPDEVSILNKSINWKIKVGSLECAASSSGSRKI